MKFFLTALLLCLLPWSHAPAQSKSAPPPPSREFRGVWISSVWNLNWPSLPGLSASEQKRELVALLDTAKKNGLNAVFLQVRPESDALYKSNLEPWSRFLTGTQGRSPGYDPLEFCITEARKRGLEVHAWINPYRAASNHQNNRAANHVSKKFARHTYRVDNTLFMDPGAEPVRDHILAVIEDLITRYDLDGIHFDDYFYPYPKNHTQPVHIPDGNLYKAYREAGGSLSRGDWRRQNVNKLIQRVSSLIKTRAPGMQFGISPFGIYTKGQPSNVTVHLDQYHHIYADPVKWLREGWVDYLAPQLYWPDRSEQSFSALLTWWRSKQANPRGIPIYAGIAVDRLSSHGWPASEVVRQVVLTRQISPGAGNGQIFFNIRNLHRNTKGISSRLREEVYAEDAP
ncbi:MAG: family 10 glycosylhydrolase, partial [Verrucomicrobiae bacterium]|nr:family 10 glycosylhydrolase [Verrucomicrobiae bacterium]